MLYITGKCFGLLATKLDYLWAVYHKNHRVAFLCLKYAAFSFIREETCLGMFAVKFVSSQRYCTGKRFSASSQRVMLFFISFCSKERFRLSSAKLRCFQLYRTGLFLVFLRKLCFWPFVLSKTYSGVLAMRSYVSRILLQKNRDLVFRFGIPFFESHSSENAFFCMLATKLRCFEF